MFNQNEITTKPLDFATSQERATFIRQTYLHVALALLTFVLVETIILNIPGIEQLAYTMTNGYNWLIVLGLFWGASWLSEKWAMSDTGQAMQYAGLGIYILAQAILFVPILYVAVNYAGAELITTAATITTFLFIGLSLVVFMTGKDFSFLRTIITVSSFVALGAIVAGVIFGFNLGLWFSFFMVALVGASILYQTSNLVNVYNTNQHVAAALGLFASFMTLFFYILRILMASRD